MDDDGEFSAYASARWATLVRSGIVLGCSVEEAHDLAQETLVRCYTSWRRVRMAHNRDAYVYRVLLNCHRDTRRRRWWGEKPTAELPDRPSADHSSDVAVADAIHQALADLSPVNRKVVVLRYYADLSERETAEVLGIAIGTVKSRLSRALAQLALDANLAETPEGHTQ